jgi:hypothetical protein
MGILVDCKPYKAKVPKLDFRTTPPPARRELFPVVALGLGMLFVLALTVGVLSARWTCAPEPAAVQAEAAVAPDQTHPASPVPFLRESASPLPAEAAAAAELKQVSDPPPAALLPDVAAEKNEVSKSEPAATVEPVKLALAQAKDDSCSTGMCKANDVFHRTAVTFAASPKLAAEQAVKDKKLVFVLHVSGNFEDPGFT